ncbi:MAG TPA: hydroxymethylglutaryl-CoA reductase, degradative [Anaerolineaceae bacterium]|nr:hydroxymethylglutaryl-CoA reductase, degradative [Anaerolineaceae bacterium]
MEKKTPKFYELPVSSRLEQLAREAGLPLEDLLPLAGAPALTPETADYMIENALGVFGLPLGVARNFLINGREVLVPMVIEEPSVVAGASYMAKLVRSGGGFTAETTAPEMIGQLQLLDITDLTSAKEKLLAHREELLALAGKVDPVLARFGGGPRDIEVREISDSLIGPFLVLHLIYDVRDAMGANAINTALEQLAPRVAQISGGRPHLRILSNLADKRLARAECTIPLSALGFGEYTPEMVRDGIIEAWAFAAADPYRAATHNKGIMNGVDAVILATGNDWRAVEAGAHAFAARGGRYTSLTAWQKTADGSLKGTLQMPMAVGIIGGATRSNPAAAAALKLMKVNTAAELAQVIVSVGLAQNLAALRALATEGIQRGHMGLHARQVALAAGAVGDEVNRLAQQLVNENNIRSDRAVQLLQEWRS